MTEVLQLICSKEKFFKAGQADLALLLLDTATTASDHDDGDNSDVDDDDVDDNINLGSLT